jgi:hypothetical protein
MRLHSPSQLRVDPADLQPVEAQFPELMAPLARAINNGKCPACGASVHGVLDGGTPAGSQVQITCFGDPPHVFIFDANSGHIGDQPVTMGTLGSEVG